MGIGTPFTLASTATRHMLDPNVTFGMAGDRYNARDKYRTKYTDGQRSAAGVGAAFGVAIPTTAAVAWARRGGPVPGIASFADKLQISRGLATNSGRVVGGLAAAGATYAGVRNLIDITKDDGDFGAVGTASGIVAGAGAGMALGNRVAGKYAPLVTGAGAVLGGIGGNIGGSAIDAGPGAIGQTYEQAPQVDADAGDRALSFGRGMVNHFNEVGPTTQGVSLGYSWGMRDTVQKRYSNAERAGAMHGDLAAAGILGGGALAVAAGLTGIGAEKRAALAAKLGTTAPSNLKYGADVAGKVLGASPMMNAIQRMGTGKAAAIGAGAAGLAGAVAYKEFARAQDAGGNGALMAGGALAATAGTAGLVARSKAMEGVAAAPKAAGSALVAAALIGVLSSARLPLQQFMNDAKDSQAARGATDWTVAGPATGIGAAAGGYGAFSGLQKLVPQGGVQLGKFHLSKGLVVGAGTAISGLATGGMGLGLSSTMPDAKTTGISVAGGAAAGLALAGVARGVNVKGGLAAGSMLGLSASSLLNDEQPAA